jgi:hypothetical protein
MKEKKIGYCESCYPNDLLDSYHDIIPEETEVSRFSETDKYLCSYHHTTEGNCQECGNYIPLEQDDMNFAPMFCSDCT